VAAASHSLAIAGLGLSVASQGGPGRGGDDVIVSALLLLRTDHLAEARTRLLQLNLIKQKKHIA
jgi:hypothetical protein